MNEQLIIPVWSAIITVTALVAGTWLAWGPLIPLVLFGFTVLTVRRG